MKKVLLVFMLFFAKSIYAEEITLFCDVTYVYDPITNEGRNTEDVSQKFLFDVQNNVIKYIHSKNGQVVWKYNDFQYNDKNCIIPYPLVMAYALAMLNAGDARFIYLAGFDGYKSGDKRSIQVEHVWDLYKKNKNNVEIISITETNYKIKKGSLYSFL